MAVWQFRMALIPRKPLIERFGVIPEARSATDAWDWVWSEQPPKDYPTVIESFTTEYKSWSSDIRMWGSENGNRLHIVMEADRVAEASARISPREEWIGFAEGIVVLAKHCDWVLSLPDQRLFLPDLDTLVSAVAASNAMKFCSDPVELLGGLGDGKYKLE